jgi:hypothetical protein
MEASMTNEPTLQIAVLDRGFVYVGLCRIDGAMLTITNAYNVRRWGSDKGLGLIAQSGPTSKTALDPAGTVHAPITALIHLIDCDSAAWAATMAQAA